MKKSLLLIASLFAFVFLSLTTATCQVEDLNAATSGTSYRVQIMALNNPVDVSYFSLKLKINLYVKQETDGSTVKYTIGVANYEEAMRLCSELEKRGLKDAFIVKYNANTGSRIIKPYTTLLAVRQRAIY